MTQVLVGYFVNRSVISLPVKKLKIHVISSHLFIFFKHLLENSRLILKWRPVGHLLSLTQVMEISDHNLRTMFFVTAPIKKQSNSTPSVKDL